MLLQRWTLTFVFLTFCFYLIALINESAILYLFCWGSVGLLLVMFMLAYIGSIGLEHRRSGCPQHLWAGDRVEVEERFRNRGSFPKVNLVFHEVFTNQTQGRKHTFSGLLPWLGGGEEAVARLSLSLERRGLYLVGPLVVDALDPLGLFGRRRVFQGTASFLVYPRPEPLPLALPPPSPSLWRVGTQNPLRRGEGLEFYGLREYQEGDDLRRVDWKSTARLETLHVREFHREQPAFLAVALDVSPGQWSKEGFERAVTAAASLLYLGVQRGYAVRLFTQQTPGEGLSGLEAGLAHLATVRPEAQEGMASLLQRMVEGIPSGSFLALLTADPQPLWVEVLLRFLQQRVALLPLWGEPLEGTSSLPPAIEALQAKGVAPLGLPQGPHWPQVFRRARWIRLQSVVGGRP